MNWNLVGSIYGRSSYQVSVHLAEGFQRRGLKCEMLTNDRRRTTDAKWWQKLTLPLARWAKNEQSRETGNIGYTKRRQTKRKHTTQFHFKQITVTIYLIKNDKYTFTAYLTKPWHCTHWQNLSQNFVSSTPSHELEDMRMGNLSLSIYNFVHMYTIGLQTKYVDKSNNCSISPKTGNQYTNIS
jgi:hypothetical protein